MVALFESGASFSSYQQPEQHGGEKLGGGFSKAVVERAMARTLSSTSSSKQRSESKGSCKICYM